VAGVLSSSKLLPHRPSHPLWPSSLYRPSCSCNAADVGVALRRLEPDNRQIAEQVVAVPHCRA